jgi:hypothetical protein
MLRTKYERQAVIQRLLNKKQETNDETFPQEFTSINQFPSNFKSTISKENDYDIPAEVIISQNSKAKRNLIENIGPDTMNRYVY